MSKMLSIIIKTFVLLAVLMICFALPGCTRSETMEVVVSPNVLNLESGGGDFTIHADIKYRNNLDVKVYIDESTDSVKVLSTSADNRGELVVKCDIQHIREIVEPGKVTFKLTVKTEDGVLYLGTDTIEIISRGK